MNKRRARWGLLLIVLLAACGPTAADAPPSAHPPTPSQAQPAPTTAAPTVAAAAPSPTAAAVEATPAGAAADAGSIRELTILYTNDEHGWMEGTAPDATAADLAGLWREEEGFDPNGPYLLLSGGDMWTGPAISTWFEGQSMVEVMNAMGYAAAAVGNHEFDFGLPALRNRAAAATFPFLSANIRTRSDNTTPTDQGIERFVVREVNGIQIGIIGLTTTLTPETTKPDNVAGFVFLDYETALREVVPEAIAAGAELIVVPGHVCQGELTRLARQIADLGVHFLGGGHCNELFAETGRRHRAARRRRQPGQLRRGPHSL